MAAVAPSAPSAPSAPPETERPKYIYAPMGAEADASGPLTMTLPAGGVGSSRILSFPNGHTVDTNILGPADITKSIDGGTMAFALGLSEEALANAGNPGVIILEVISEVPPPGLPIFCGAEQTKYLLLRQLNTPADPTATFLFLTGQPGEAGASVCRKLVYTMK